MRRSTFIFVILSAILFALISGGAQQPAPRSEPTAAKGPATQKTEPCWEQAGISKNVMEQRRSIQESTRSEIRAVCSEPNLSEEQKRERIRQIRQAARERADAIISPAERQQLEACQRARHASGPKAGDHPAGSDPCAGLGR